jgi:hypothetical protein
MSEPVHPGKAAPAWFADAKDYALLRRPQVRVLQALACAAEPLTSRQIADLAKVSVTTVVLGGLKGKAAGQSHESTGYPGLIDLKFVEEVQLSAGEAGVRPQRAYRLTEAGRKALAGYEAKNGKKLPPVQPGPPKAEPQGQAAGPDEPGATDLECTNPKGGAAATNPDGPPAEDAKDTGGKKPLEVEDSIERARDRGDAREGFENTHFYDRDGNEIKYVGTGTSEDV